MGHNWRIELQDVGRRKVNRFVEITAQTLPDAEDRAIRECGQHLMSRDIGLLDKTDMTYTVMAGMRPVGHVKIVSI